MKHIKLYEQFIAEGAGNFRIRYEGVDWPTYYASYPDFDGDALTPYEYMTDLKDEIKNMKSVKKYGLKPADSWIDNGAHIIFENDVAGIALADNEWSLAIGIVPTEEYYFDRDENTMDEFNEQATAILNDIAEFADLHERTGPWTSKPVKGRIKVNY